MELKKFCLFLLQFLLFHNNFNSTNAMIGDNIRKARSREFPYVGAILKVSNESDDPLDTIQCGATLISRQDLLTAEHCLENFAPGGFKILLGSNLLTEGIIHSPMWWMSYNMWFQTQFNRRPHHIVNDIAIIKLTRNVINTIPHAQIFNVSNIELYGSQGAIVGWGNSKSGRATKKLRVATVTTLHNDECLERIRALSRISLELVFHTRICTVGTRFALLRKGDSGGPLIINNRVAAVNHGWGPVLENVDYDRRQLNFHFSLFYYSEFIWDAVTNYNVNF